MFAETQALERKESEYWGLEGQFLSTSGNQLLFGLPPAVPFINRTFSPSPLGSHCLGLRRPGPCIQAGLRFLLMFTHAKIIVKCLPAQDECTLKPWSPVFTNDLFYSHLFPQTMPIKIKVINVRVFNLLSTGLKCPLFLDSSHPPWNVFE